MSTDKSDELRAWAKKHSSSSSKSSLLSKSVSPHAANSSEDKTNELNDWASRQKTSLSKSFAAVKMNSKKSLTSIKGSNEKHHHDEADERRDSSASMPVSTASSSEGKRTSSGPSSTFKEDYLAAKAEHVTKNSSSNNEYVILSLGICSLREGNVKSQGYFTAISPTKKDTTTDTTSNSNSSNVNKDSTTNEFVTMANNKLTKVTESDFCTIMSCENDKKCTWFVKSYEGWIYYIKATNKYPKFLAVEVLDSLSNIILFGLRPDRKTYDELCEYCKAIYLEYGTLEEGNKASQMLNQVDEIKEKMNSNINVVLENIDNAEILQEKTSELLEQSQMFKKRTRKLKKEMWMKDKGAMIIKAGTAGAVAVGATAGFLAGGPGGAAFVTVPSIVAAELIEMSLIATACGVGYYATAKAAVKSWFWSQKFVKV